MHNIRLFDLLELRPGGRVAEVLVPDRGVAPGLRRLLRELGLPLRSGGNSLQTLDNWIARIQDSHLALVGPDREAPNMGLPAALAPGPRALDFPTPQPRLAGAAGRLQGRLVLRQTGRVVGRMGGSEQLDG